MRDTAMTIPIELAEIARSFPEMFDEHILGLPDSLLDLLPIGVYVCDREGAIVRFSRCAAELWGRTPKLRDPTERFCGSYRVYRLDGAPIARADCPMVNVLATGTPVRNQEIVIERPGGSRFVALVHIDALRDSTGSIVGAVNCFRDITEQTHPKAALHDGEWYFHKLLERLPVAVYTTDAAGRITFCNQAAVDFWGRRPELGKDEWCGSWRLYCPDGTPMAHDECPLAVALKERRPIRGAEAVAERPDGTRIPFLPYPTPLFDKSGVLIGAVNALVDITEHKRAAEAGERLASIVESSQDAILSKDLNGIIVSWNPGAEQLFGYTAAEMIGKSVTMLIPADRHDEEPVILARIRNGERVDHYETIRRRKDGSLVEISLTVSPIRGARGRIIGASKIARDITERKRAQERQLLILREMNHRVKNLFAVASSVVALSRRSARTPEEMAAAVRERLSALSRAHQLTLPDLTEHEKQADKETTLGTLVRAIVSPYDEPEHNGAARVCVKGPDVSVRGSAVTSLALLLHEFATNAAKYGALSSQTGHIDINWSVEKGELLLAWTEQGGPHVEQRPEGEGFGSWLAGATVGQLGGEISRDWKPEGLTIHLSACLDRLMM
jgi:PAS domain S-box-containing protein